MLYGIWKRDTPEERSSSPCDTRPATDRLNTATKHTKRADLCLLRLLPI
jgi:hypothetical protein